MRQLFPRSGRPAHSGRIVLFVSAAAIVSAASALAQSSPPPPPVTVAKPVVKDITEWDEFTGRFEATETVEIRSRVTGYLDKVLFKDGAMVKAGDPLFVIDQRPYKAAYDRALSSVVVSQSRFEFSQNDLDRAEQLRKTNNIADQVLDQRRQNFLAAQAELAGAKATAESARLDFEFTTIKAPIAGRISRKLVSEGNLVNANDTVLTTIVSLDPIHFYFDVDERSYIAYSRKGLSGSRPSSRDVANEVLVAVTDEKEPVHKGKMDFVDNRIDNAAGTMRGRAIFPNPDLFLTPGMFGRVRLIGSGLYKGVLVPDESIASDQDRRVVFVVADDGTVTPRPVRTGPRIDGYRVVREGLKGDETIAVNGLMRIRPGVKVAPQMTTLPPVRERSGS
jgi:RND family efflux transporter MFP subunit